MPNEEPRNGAPATSNNASRHIHDLPLEVLGRVVSFIDLSSLVILAATSHTLRRFVYMTDTDDGDPPLHRGFTTIDFAGTQSWGVPADESHKTRWRCANGVDTSRVLDSTVKALFSNMSAVARSSVRVLRLDWTFVTRSGLNFALAACANRSLRELSLTGCKGIDFDDMESLQMFARRWLVPEELDPERPSASGEPLEAPSSSSSGGSGQANNSELGSPQPRPAPRSQTRSATALEEEKNNKGKSSKEHWSDDEEDEEEEELPHASLLDPVLPEPISTRLLQKVSLAGISVNSYPIALPTRLDFGLKRFARGARPDAVGKIVPFEYRCCGFRAGPLFAGEQVAQDAGFGRRNIGDPRPRSELRKFRCTRCNATGTTCGYSAEQRALPPIGNLFGAQAAAPAQNGAPPGIGFLLNPGSVLAQPPPLPEPPALDEDQDPQNRFPCGINCHLDCGGMLCHVCSTVLFNEAVAAAAAQAGPAHINGENVEGAPPPAPGHNWKARVLRASGWFVSPRHQTSCFCPACAKKKGLDR